MTPRAEDTGRRPGDTSERLRGAPQKLVTDGKTRGLERCESAAANRHHERFDPLIASLRIGQARHEPQSGAHAPLPTVIGGERNQ
jgi:hypothetical protein